MAIPDCYASTYDYDFDPVILDVANVIIKFRALVTGLSTPWTEPVADTFQSPADANGKYFQILLSAVSAQRLRIIVKNPALTVISDRCIDIENTGSEVRYWVGQFHGFIEFERATPEFGGGAILDLSPDGQASHSNWVVGTGYRFSNGVVDGAGSDCAFFFILDNGTPTAAQRLWLELQAQGTTIQRKTPSGAYIGKPSDVVANFAGANFVAGRIYQAVIVDASLPFGAEIPVPIGDNTSGIFKVTGRGTCPVGNGRLALRIGP